MMKAVTALKEAHVFIGKRYKRVEGNLYEIWVDRTYWREAARDLVAEGYDLEAREGAGNLGALVFYQDAIRLDPTCFEAWLNLGTWYYRWKAWRRAWRCYRIVIKLQPRYVPVWRNLADTYSEMGDMAKAVECYRKALEIDPRYADGHYNLALVYEKLRDYRKAAEHLMSYRRYTTDSDLWLHHSGEWLEDLRAKDLRVVER